MAEIGCSLPTDIIYFKLPAEKGNIKKNRYSRILDNGSGHLFTPCVVTILARIFKVYKQILLNQYDQIYISLG